MDMDPMYRPSRVTISYCTTECSLFFFSCVRIHDVLGLLEPLGAERGFQEPKRRIALSRVHLVKTDSLANVEMLVHPLAPFRIVDGKLRLSLLLRVECFEQGQGGLADGFRRDTGGANMEEIFLNLSVGRDSLERFGEAILLRSDRILAESSVAVATRLRDEQGRKQDGKGNYGKEQSGVHA